MQGKVLGLIAIPVLISVLLLAQISFTTLANAQLNIDGTVRVGGTPTPVPTEPTTPSPPSPEPAPAAPEAPLPSPESPASEPDIAIPEPIPPSMSSVPGSGPSGEAEQLYQETAPIPPTPPQPHDFTDDFTGGSDTNECPDGVDPCKIAPPNPSPADPTDPIEKIHNEGPADPTDPVEKIHNEGPVDPTDPVEKIKNEGPVDPDTPILIFHPKNEGPVDPTTPILIIRPKDLNNTNLGGSPLNPILKDTTPPTTTSNVSDGASYPSPVTVQLSCDDGSTGSGCATTWYCSNTISCTPGTTYTTPFTLSSGGTYFLSYFSTDQQGNAEVLTSISFSVNAPPSGGGGNGGGTILDFTRKNETKEQEPPQPPEPEFPVLPVVLFCDEGMTSCNGDDLMTCENNELIFLETCEAGCQNDVCLIPETTTSDEGETDASSPFGTVTGFLTQNVSGLFVGLLAIIVIGSLYFWLRRRNDITETPPSTES
ncbi:MAG: hypothetical protein KKA90_01845 [Nanoarchaeota archaeon]|nr:hypothetical protein [Nanoarchaeota archaeon]